jgi:hypothetical protein
VVERDAALRAAKTKTEGVVATGNAARAKADAALAELMSWRKRFEAACDELGKERRALRLGERRTASVEALAKYAGGLTAKMPAERLESAREELTQRWSEEYAVAPLKALSPEQLGWSVLQATGVLGQYRASAEKEINKPDPKAPKNASPPPVKKPVGPADIERWVHSKLNPSVKAFVSVYAAGPGQPQGEFFATVDQALFVANGGSIQSWLNGGGELAARAAKASSPQALADEVYMSVLSRSPTPGESKEVADCLSRRPKEKLAAARDLAWALLASNEFRFNH